MYWNFVTGSIFSTKTCWIVTLDVLKSLSDLYQQTNDNCWIVTLDVLKYLDEDVLIPYENVE